MLIIHSPDTFRPEREYAIRTIFHVFLGLSITLCFEDRNSYAISMSEDNFHSITIKNLFSGSVNIPDQGNACFNKGWLRSLSFVPEDLRLNLKGQGLPILATKDIDTSCPIKQRQGSISLDFDLFGSTFYLLTRMEEYQSPDLDKHGRFPASASHAFKNGYLDRPIVDEYVEILWSCMKKLWPRLERKPRNFQMKLTHDVDIPFENMFKSPYQLARSMAGDVLKRKNLPQAFKRAANWISTKSGSYRKDPAYTFELIMDLGEKHGVRDDFYFIPQNSHQLDGNYDLEHPYILNLMKYIYDRGHNIGYHGSYSTFQDPTRTKIEVTRLKRVASSLGIEQETWGGRQHYLRWEAPTTWRNYAEAGLNYDTTLSYADHAGFRCGTCRPFPVFDLKRQKPLDLWEYPLIVMECSVLDDRYMGLPIEEAYDYIVGLKKTCRKYNGCFTLLWHNSRFVDPAEVELYEQILKA